MEHSANRDNVEFIGIDIGHGETAAAYVRSLAQDPPKPLEVHGRKTVLSVVATHPDLGTLIGEDAISTEGITYLARRFKRQQLDDEAMRKPMRLYASELLRTLRESAQIGLAPRTHFIVGCPTAWGPGARRKYAALLAQAGLGDVEIMSESRAAFLSLREAGELHLSADMLVDTALIIDMGSSTTDFTAVSQLREQPVDFGDNDLGAGLLDKAILDYLVQRHEHRDEIRRIFAQHPYQEGICELYCRRAKENFFSYEEKYKTISADGGSKRLKSGLYFEAAVNEADMRAILAQPLEALGRATWPAAFRRGLEAARDRLARELQPPRLVILTGGASRMRFAAEACRQVFGSATVVRGKEPEFAIAAGLALAGRIDLRVRKFHEDIQALLASGEVHEVVENEIDALIHGIARNIADVLPDRFIMPAFERWREGRTATLRGAVREVEDELGEWLHSGAANAVLLDVLSEWFRALSPRIEALTEPICARYYIPSSAFRLDGVAMHSARLSMGTPAAQMYDELADVLNLALSTIIAVVITAVSTAITLGLGAILVWVISLVAGDVVKRVTRDAVFDANIPPLLRRTIPPIAVRQQMLSRRGQIEADLVDGFAGAPAARQELVQSVVTPVTLELNHDAERVALQIR